MTTTDTGQNTGAAPRKTGKPGMLIGLFLALLLGSSGFYAVWSGMIFADRSSENAPPVAVVPGLPDFAFVPISPIMVSLSPGTNARHLRFQAQLEVAKANESEVTALLPRVIDVLNSYLRAIDPAELEKPGGLTRLRAQMLRRVQIVTGDGRVRDLLIMEFVLS